MILRLTGKETGKGIQGYKKPRRVKSDGAFS